MIGGSLNLDWIFRTFSIYFRTPLVYIASHQAWMESEMTPAEAMSGLAAAIAPAHFPPRKPQHTVALTGTVLGGQFLIEVGFDCEHDRGSEDRPSHDEMTVESITLNGVAVDWDAIDFNEQENILDACVESLS